MGVIDTWELHMLHKLRQTTTIRTMGHSWPCVEPHSWDFLTSAVVIYDRIAVCPVWSWLHALDTGWFTGKCVNSFLLQTSAVDYSISLHLCCFETSSEKKGRESCKRAATGYSEASKFHDAVNSTIGQLKGLSRFRRSVKKLNEDKPSDTALLGFGSIVLLVLWESHTYISIVLSGPV